MAMRSGPRLQDQFPMKLYTMLELADAARGFAWSLGAVAWLPHGRAFHILDEETFVDAVAPLFFRLTKIRSFHRQLYLWGFKRVSEGIDAGAWYHALFLRGSPGELRKMVRIKIKKTLGNPPDTKEDPNFYAMPPLGGGRRVSKEAIPAMDGLPSDRTPATNLARLVLPEPELSGRASSPKSASGRRCAPRRNNASVPTSCNVTLHEFGNAGRNDRASEGGANVSWDVARPSMNDPSSRRAAAAFELLKMHGKLPARSGGVSLPNSAPLPSPPSLFRKNGRISDGGRRAPSAARFSRDAPRANPSLLSRGVLDRRLGRRSESSAFPADDEGPSAAKMKRLPSDASFGSAAAGTNPLPVGVSSDEEAKRMLTSGLEPLPFANRPAASEAVRRSAAAGRKVEPSPPGASSASFPSDGEEKRRLTAGLEPLPIGDERPADEFSNYIDSAIQML